MVTKTMSTLPQKLYHITHNVTGKCYLGQTTKTGKAWDNYFGSCEPFTKHMEQYGKDVTKLILFESSDPKEFGDMCLQISHGLDVVENPNYFNKVHEYGGNVGGAANPNFKDGKWVGRHHNKELERRLYKEADAKKYIKAKASGIAKYRSAAIHAKRRGDKKYAKQNFEKWKLLCVESNKGNALQPSDTFEFWWQVVGQMSWEKREKFYG